MNDLISVIVPVYKVEEYLDECVKSIISQSYSNLEIILVDDGSPDKCPELCDLWTTKDNRIKVVHKCNGGLSSARNAGLDIACGDYISFVDSDDYIAPDMIANLYNCIIENKTDISACKIYSITNNNILVYDKIGNEIKDKTKVI
ncbi:MAG: glycosyltransferase, partial [Agathobacter sp.]|nr:glycosyltransferase [Agathobacter sp.]